MPLDAFETVLSHNPDLGSILNRNLLQKLTDLHIRPYSGAGSRNVRSVH